jgi:hypothetical protein
MTADDPRREFLNKVELFEKETTHKMNRDFSTIVDTYIAKGNIKLLKVFSETIKKTESTEKAYDIMMCILPQMGDNGDMLAMFDWFLTQTKDFDEVVSKLNICIPFETENLFNLQSYEQCQFTITQHSRASIQDFISKVENFNWEVPDDQKSLVNIIPAIVDHGTSDIYVYTKGIREEDRDIVRAKTSDYD